MKKYWKVVGIAAVAAGLLYYPAMKLYKYIVEKNSEKEENGEAHIVKNFLPSYRGKHKSHYRNDHNGKTGLA